jgi:hypothetical protein
MVSLYSTLEAYRKLSWSHISTVLLKLFRRQLSSHTLGTVTIKFLIASITHERENLQ